MDGWMNESIGSINSSLQLQAESISVSAKHMWFLLGLYCRQQLCYCSCSNKYIECCSLGLEGQSKACVRRIYRTVRNALLMLYCTVHSLNVRETRKQAQAARLSFLFLLTVSYLYSIVYYYLYIILYIHHNIV